jgi:serine/threonine protein kinase
MRLCAFGHLMLDGELEALCGQCLMGVVPLPLTPIGRFERLKKLGEGGFGCVYLARAGTEGPLVALKNIRNGHFASERALARFRAEINILSQLRDERIVRIDEAGEHEGLPFFTMEYMEGGTLRARMSEYQGSPRRAAELMIEIAGAVDFLRSDPNDPARPQILHRDLKPENILFDGLGRPRISDFGIAKLCSMDTGRSSTTFHAGCPWYVAPEQVFHKRYGARAPTASEDVYSLGAILYELFTGQVPFDGTHAEVFQQLGDEHLEPRAPRALAPGLDRYLETVVLNALEKNPSRRYGSARAFAADLQRALAAKPPEELPALSLRERLRRKAALLATLLWSIAFLCYGVRHEYRARVAESAALERQLQENGSLAQVQAVAFQFQLREYQHRLARLSTQPDIVALLHSTKQQAPSQVLLDRLYGFDSLFVLAPDGVMRARTTWKPEEYLNRSFAFRDYFQGARELGRRVCANGASKGTSDQPAAYLSRAHISESEGEFEIAISAPVCDATGWIGILAATISSNRSFGAVRLVDGPAGHLTALLGPRGADRKDLGHPPPTGFTFIVHPNLSPGKEYQLRYPEPERIRASLGIRAQADGLRYVSPLLVPDYHDPVNEPEGLWTAALASVDESGFVVLVQSRRAPGRTRFAGFRELAAEIALFAIGLGALTLLHARSRRWRRSSSSLASGRSPFMP